MSPYRASLDVITIARPCSEAWARMEGTEAVRFCRACKSHVYDFSQMTRAEAQALLEITEGRVRVRFYRRADGALATKDCTSERHTYARSRRVRTARRS